MVDVLHRCELLDDIKGALGGEGAAAFVVALDLNGGWLVAPTHLGRGRERLPCGQAHVLLRDGGRVHKGERHARLQR